MSESPLVTIIIPSFNRAHLIGETLNSVLAQTYQNWECIVVDDGSTDNTDAVMADYMSKDSRFQYHHRPKGRLPGGNAARNYGFEISKGAYINWFDDDDIMLPNFLKEMVNCFEDGIELVINSVCYWDPKTNSKRVNYLKITTTLYQDYLCWNFGITTHSILFRKKFLLGKELFSNRIYRGQETEFFLRLFYKLPKESYKILNRQLFLYRQHEDTKTHKNQEYILLFKRSEFIIYSENFVKLQNSEDSIPRNFCYHRILSLFYASIHHNDLELAKRINSRFFPLLKDVNYLKALQLILIGKTFILFNRGSYRIVEYWKTFEF